ncbi:retrovirus-related pol polyprotein from transposon tnt 1-94, partial [Trifolium medium]|nr:retrovirus-related pol polyprotein from transposon tnt 1-94 [Trifolium medium]
MLSARDVPKRFWPEAVNWATYVMNISPTFTVQDMTPEEAWSGLKPSVHHFRVFGCLAHVHIPDVHRKKLDGKSIKCVLLGVSEESKAYKLYNPSEKRIIVSRDVIFEELKSWNWNKKTHSNSINHDIDIEEDSDIEAQDNQQVTAHENQPVDGEIDMDTSQTSEESNEESENDNDNILPPRTRQPPGYLRDYDTNTGEEGNMIHHFALFSSNE